MEGDAGRWMCRMKGGMGVWGDMGWGDGVMAGKGGLELTRFRTMTFCLYMFLLISIRMYIFIYLFYKYTYMSTNRLHTHMFIYVYVYIFQLIVGNHCFVCAWHGVVFNQCFPTHVFENYTFLAKA